MRAWRGSLLALAVASGGCVLPAMARAQALPDEVRAAGVTLAQWSSVQVEVQRTVAEKHVSERALAAVCQRMGVQLAHGRRFNLNQMVSLIAGRADELKAVNDKLELETQQNNPAAAALLKQARGAVEAGDLDGAEQSLKAAGLAARSALQNAQRQEAEITATDAQVKALQLDYLGAASTYAEAAGELPADDAHDRWTYAMREADMLAKRGELFVEPQALHQAVGLYQDAALRLVPRGADPLDWAKTQVSLGSVLETLGERGDDAALHDSIAAERGALEVLTRDHDPDDWSMAENDLGVSLQTLGYQGDDAALRQAIAAFHAALLVRTRDRNPHRWAATENDLGNALEILGERGDDGALHEAIAAYRAELEVDTRDKDPDNWALDETNLGNALDTLGRRGDDAALHDAVAAYRGALEVWTRDGEPFRWATAENGLGGALTELGQRGDGDAAALRDAAAAFRAALDVRTRERDPANWALTQNNLGDALESLGELGDRAALAEAVAADRAALEVFTRDRDPAHWAMAQFNLGDALFAERGDRDALAASVAAYRAALEVWTPAVYPAKAKKASDALARAETLLASPTR